MNRNQVEMLVRWLGPMRWPGSHLIMVGALVSPKSLRRELLKPMWQNKYPQPEALAGLFVADSRVYNLIHYNSKEPDLAGQLSRLAGVPGLNGFQLNIVWPEIEELRRFRRLHPDLQIVLQVSEKSLRSVATDAGKGFGADRLSDLRLLRERLRPYIGGVEYVLLDRSGGLGIGLDSDLMLAMVGDLAEAFGDEVRLGVAGGLEEAAVGGLKAIYEAYPWLSWDAEGLVRTDDQLDLGKCQRYLDASADLIGSPTALE